MVDIGILFAEIAVAEKMGSKSGPLWTQQPLQKDSHDCFFPVLESQVQTTDFMGNSPQVISPQCSQLQTAETNQKHDNSPQN
jgi:hypothetical protein